jgi:hypothetical protein
MESAPSAETRFPRGESGLQSAVHAKHEAPLDGSAAVRTWRRAKRPRRGFSPSLSTLNLRGRRAPDWRKRRVAYRQERLRRSRVAGRSLAVVGKPEDGDCVVTPAQPPAAVGAERVQRIVVATAANAASHRGGEVFVSTQYGSAGLPKLPQSVVRSNSRTGFDPSRKAFVSTRLRSCGQYRHRWSRF